MTAFAAIGDVTVRDTAGVSKAAPAGTSVVTHDDAVTQVDVEGVARAVTVPCPVCHMNTSGVVTAQAKETALEIRHGGFVLDVDPSRVEKKFSLRSPVAVASVRGTKFAGFVHHEGNESYFVGRGAVDVVVGEKPYPVEAGQAIDITKDGVASTRAATPEELAILESLPSAPAVEDWG
jgi:mannose-6-phosphate isomerase-like protein (cupin superfamily)